MTDVAKSIDPVADRALRVARICAWITTAAFVAGWIAVVALDHPLDALTDLATVQAIAGIATLVFARKFRRAAGLDDVRRAPVWRGIVFGLLGLLGMPVFWFLSAFDTGGVGGFGGFGAWGRPLRVRGREVHPQIRAGTEWASGNAPDVSALDGDTRRALAAWWLRDAQKEHASVPAFAKLAWQLAALGAPAELLERAYRAGLEEIDHARRCFALVSAYAGEPCGAMAMPELHLDDAATTLAQLARESLTDGCFIEDLNSDAAELALLRATDPAVHELCAIIARDERSHAELAWDLVAWCLREGGAEVDAALARAIDAIPDEGGGLYGEELAAHVARCDVADLHAHGRVPLADWPALYRTRLAATRARLAATRAQLAATRARLAALSSPSTSLRMLG